MPSQHQVIRHPTWKMNREWKSWIAKIGKNHWNYLQCICVQNLKFLVETMPELRRCVHIHIRRQTEKWHNWDSCKINLHEKRLENLDTMPKDLHCFEHSRIYGSWLIKAHSSHVHYTVCVMYMHVIIQNGRRGRIKHHTRKTEKNWKSSSRYLKLGTGLTILGCLDLEV